MSDVPEVAVAARGIAVSGPWGPVYGPVDLDVDSGGVTVLVCPAGSGRTALLLTLAGRMRPNRGALSVFGVTDPRRIFRMSAIAGIDELDQVAESVTVRDAVTEQLRWNAPWYRFVRRARAADLRTVCAPVFGDLPLPPLNEYVEELSELDRLLLRIALANTALPPLLVVGNLDYVTSDHNRELLLQRLIELGRRQTVITTTVNGVTSAAVRAQIVVDNTSRADLVHGQKGE
ncbi:ATP-binding cassette domain-containing protein [Mycolicibacterium baixiangningiae]|uniref:ATP-binding cassette domain-containing protein n=1 Tax=Mycolicibacterium baixiangningiae TaxID=2761578 RepID=UPI0018D19BD7|nr:ATP-binding cassette domain-containing protein [Mycolicibacterium baixiangningiae]